MKPSTGKFVRFEDMCWPAVGSHLHTLQDRLRYAQDCLTASDLLYAASVLAAYDQLVRNKTQVQRNYICGILKTHTEPYGGGGE